MNINERVKALRDELKLSQSAFGEKLGVKRDVIANIELSRAPIKELMINLICKTFKVNPLWLEKEEGDMFLDIPEAILDEVALEYDLSPTEKNIVANYLRMSPEDRRKVVELIHKLIQ